MKGLSKFEYREFIHDGKKVFAVNAQKYSQIEAEDIFNRVCGDCDIVEYGTATVSWSIGTNELGDRCAAWKLDFIHNGTELRYCQVWTFLA